MKILIIYGSLRANALSKAFARAVQKNAPHDLLVELSGIEGFPAYDDVLEKTAFPQAALALKEKIAKVDGVVIVTPEYNRSLPGALKNAIDWTSRPDDEEFVWKQKPVGVLSVSDGARGGSFANYDVRRILTYFDAHVMGQPELHLGEADKKINTEGNFSDEKWKARLVKFLEAFKKHVELFKKGA